MVENYNQLYFNLGISILIIVVRFFIGGKKDPLTYMTMFYFFFTFGPIINHLLGLPIYFGTPQEYILAASNNFAIAIVTMSLISFLFPYLKEKSEQISPNRDYHFLKFIFIAFTLYAIIQSLYVLFFSFGGSKIDKINFLIPKIHYNYLMIQVYLVSFYFLLKQKKLYWINLISYIFYCLITGERDFIFPLVAIGIHLSIFSHLNFKQKVILFITGIGFFGLATLIFFLRDSSQESSSVLGSILNQGSLLFINAYTIKLLNDSYEFFNGFTYLNSIQNLLPSWIYKTDFNTLAWFKNNYAPKSNSGYGFGLDAEGYMNFGHIGVVCTFVFITIIQKITFMNFSSKDFFKYYSVFFTAFTMYSFRNDSLAFFKGNLYAIIFFGIIFYISNLLDNRKNHESIS